MNTKPLRFLRRGQMVTLDGVEPNRTLLDLLREELHCSGTKEGCGEGDCGACTVVLGQEVAGALELRAVNSCIRLAHSIDGMALWTVEDVADAQAGLHPVQQAMLECHGSQCGFCTPGFVMSLFALYQHKAGQPISRAEAQEALSGNLCRCTGYRPILEAASTMQALPERALNRPAVLAGLRQLAGAAAAHEFVPDGQHGQSDPAGAVAASDASYLRPATLAALLDLRARHPQAQLVAGCTDVGLWINKLHLQFERIIDTTGVAELRRIEDYPHHIAIGAAAPLTDAFAALLAGRPQLQGFVQRFAGLPVRNAGTLGGNVANGSPIGDSMPLLIALGANVVLMSQHGHRELRLESFYTGYRKNLLAGDEVLAWIKVPKPLPTEFSRVYKVSKRWEDDISAVCLAISLQLQEGRVQQASIGVGGVAATPVRAVRTEDVLRGQPWSQALVQQAMAVLRQEFSPISDMRASATYRSQVLGNLLQRFWLESQGVADVSLQTHAPAALVLQGASV